jgi:Tol biopolymer transport system component/DNA-binding winged helix-turn-helix (wHTH) protein
MNSPGQSSLTPFRLGKWRIFPDRYELLGDGGTQRKVPPLLVALLLRLTEAAGRTVTREALLASVWQRSHVNDEVLSRAIADLRRALDDDARQPGLIGTVPKLGYRLLAPAVPIAIDIAETGVSESDQHSGQGTARPRRAAVALGIGVVAAALVASACVWLVNRDHAVTATIPAPADMVHARPLVSDPGWSQSPRFSRNGDLIAYSAGDPDSNVGRIRVRSRDGRVTATIENQGQWDICPLFSHDGMDLFWTRHDGSGCHLMRVSLAGGASQSLAACATGVRSCPDLSPDGGGITFTADLEAPPGAVGLARLDLRDGTITAWPDPAIAPLNDAEPRYSPNGEYLAFLRGRSSNRRLLVMAIESQSTRSIPLMDARIYGMTWLDDSHLLLATDSEGRRALVRLDIRDASRELMGVAGARYPDRAADGALVWEMAHYESNLWLVDADGGERRLTEHRRSDGGQVLSPDGRHLAFQSNREGPDSIWILALDSGDERRLPLPAADTWTDPAWSPDGSTILMSRYRGATSQVWSYRLDSAGPRPVPGIPDGAHDAQFAANGTGIWFVTTSPDGERTLWLAAQVTDNAATSPLQWSIDSFLSHASGLFVQRPLDGGLWRCNVAGSDCHALLAADGAPLPAADNWTVAGTALYRQTAGDDGTTIWRIPFDHQPAQRMPWPASTSGQSLAVMSDGQGAVIARGALTQLELGWLPPRAQREQ